jgi:hypothetical protein
LIGVPVAATPGFGPHEDVVEAVVVVLEAVEVVELDVLTAAALELLLELPPHPTSAAEPSSAASKIVTRLQVIMPRPLLTRRATPTRSLRLRRVPLVVRHRQRLS